MSIGSLAFLNPALLAGLLALPLIYWLLRTVPPAPRRVEFPATRILVGIENKEKQPSKTPWWLTLIRLLAAALLILALAEPVLNPNRQTAVSGNGPVAIVVDNSWAASSGWSERTRMIDRLITEAEAQGRPVVIAPTALTAKSPVFKIEAAAQARSSAAAIVPQPFAPDRMLTAKALETTLAGTTAGSSLIWITDGIDHDGTTAQFAEKAAALAHAGSAIVIDIPSGQEALGLSASLGQGGRLETDVVRAAGAARQGAVHAFSARGQRLAESRFNFAVNETRATLRFDMPLELRNQVTRVEVAGERSAGAVHLLDARAQWHRIGILSGASREQAQPLLAPLYYVERALAPFAELAKSEDANLAVAVEDLMKRNISILLLADIGTLSGALKERVDNWVKKGGVLIRFSGSRLEKGGDDLLPSPLRVGGRALGGALSWSTPQPLGAFTDDSLFAGLAIPADVLVNRQVLAEPGRIGPDVKSWARLKDGTPLVTAAKRGDGQIVLFHVTANSEWSSLPISGLFVEMLRRIATLGKAGGVSGEATIADNKDTTTTTQNENAEVLPPLQVLDGFGLLKAPPPTAESIAASKINDAKPSAINPPGYYGPQASPRALNLISTKTVLKPLPALPSAFERRAYESGTAKPLKPTLMGLALALLFADILAVLALNGGLSALSRAVATRSAAWLLIASFAGLLLPTTHADAQNNPGGPIRPFSPNDLNRQPGTFFGSPLLTGPAAPQRTPATGADATPINATAKVSLGYVLSGDAAADQTSQQGLTGLIRYLTAKTAVEPGEASAVNIQNDEIAFYPILYWPVLQNARPLNDKTLAKIDAYMKQGGMIIFDTRDAGTALPAGFGLQVQGGGNPLQRLLGTLDIPRLEPVPESHVLTKSFYLLRQFPGRFDNGQLWVEAEAPADSNQGRQARRVDGVSSILVTSNDFASAWALDERSRPLFPVVPGGETQREIAFRVGVNIVMYALTGNYKADQVHIPALLERLGQ